MLIEVRQGAYKRYYVATDRIGTPPAPKRQLADEEEGEGEEDGSEFDEEE